MLPVQSKMARAATGLGIRELAAASGVSADTISRLERGETLQPRTVAAIRNALEAAGVEFLTGGGVRLNRPAYNPDDIRKTLTAYKSAQGRNAGALRILMGIMADESHGGLPNDLVQEVRETLPFEPAPGWPGRTAS